MTAPGVLADRSHDELVVLVRELLLAGHLIDRAGMPLLLTVAPVEEMRDVAIEEWMGASPIYTRRMQRLLGFEGDDVATIFKGMQLDIGAPPQFMDFRYRVADHDHGEFWLAHCGALMDVEPMGDEMVHTMCTHIEDPTFPATACATNPRARMDPIHRPPRVPADRHPHCHWTVTINPAADPAPEPAQAVRLAASEAARLPLPAIDRQAPDGRSDYAGPLEDDVPLGDLSSSALAAVAEEAALQGHLLVLSFLAAVADRRGADVATDIGRRQLGGVGAVVAGRLRDALGVADDLAGLAEVLAVHPALLPAAYVDVAVELVPAGRPDAATATGAADADADADRGAVDDGAAGGGAWVRQAVERLVVAVRGGPALAEAVAPSWPMLLDVGPEGTPSPLEVLCRGAAPRARVRSVPAADGEHARWEVTLADEAAPEPDEVVLTRFSTGASFTFEPR